MVMWSIIIYRTKKVNRGEGTYRMKNALLVSLLLLLVSCGTSTPAIEPSPTTLTNAAEEPTVVVAAVAPTIAPADPAAVPAQTAAARVFVIDGAQSSASYAVEEIFLSDNRLFTAVGVTNAVEGAFEVSSNGKPSGKVTRIRVDLRTLKSDSPRRDNAIRRQWLESDTYPYADFVSTGALNLPERYTEGAQVTFTLEGNMTVRDVTKPVDWTVVGTLQGNTITGEAKTVIKMSDFGFAAPDIGGVLKAEDEVALTVTFVAVEK
jgi:polyisoprenoid-binding protein YceI